MATDLSATDAIMQNTPSTTFNIESLYYQLFGVTGLGIAAAYMYWKSKQTST